MACALVVSMFAGCGSSQEKSKAETNGATASTEQGVVEAQNTDEDIELTIMGGAQLTSVAELY